MVRTRGARAADPSMLSPEMVLERTSRRRSVLPTKMVLEEEEEEEVQIEDTKEEEQSDDDDDTQMTNEDLDEGFEGDYEGDYDGEFEEDEEDAMEEDEDMVVDPRLTSFGKPIAAPASAASTAAPAKKNSLADLMSRAKSLKDQGVTKRVESSDDDSDSDDSNSDVEEVSIQSNKAKMLALEQDRQRERAAAEKAAEEKKKKAKADKLTAARENKGESKAAIEVTEDAADDDELLDFDILANAEQEELTRSEEQSRKRALGLVSAVDFNQVRAKKLKTEKLHAKKDGFDVVVKKDKVQRTKIFERTHKTVDASVLALVGAGTAGLRRQSNTQAIGVGKQKPAAVFTVKRK